MSLGSGLAEMIRSNKVTSPRGRLGTGHQLARVPSRDGEAGLCPAEPNRGKAWKPSQGFHIMRAGSVLPVYSATST
jgi:hypothetical protein